MRQFFRVFTASFLFALAVPSLSTCGTASTPQLSTPPQTSGVRGMAKIVGGPAPGTSRPTPGVTIVVHEGDIHGRIVVKSKTDSSGAFKIDLPPGTYTLNESFAPAAAPQTVTVEAGKYVSVTITISAM